MGLLWAAGVEPVALVESLEQASAVVWLEGLGEGLESWEGVVCLLPASQQDGTAAGLRVLGGAGVHRSPAAGLSHQQGTWRVSELAAVSL